MMAVLIDCVGFATATFAGSLYGYMALICLASVGMGFVSAGELPVKWFLSD